MGYDPFIEGSILDAPVKLIEPVRREYYCGVAPPLEARIRVHHPWFGPEGPVGVVEGIEQDDDLADPNPRMHIWLREDDGEAVKYDLLQVSWSYEEG